LDAPDWPDQETALALVGRLPDDPAAPADFLAAVYLPLLGDAQSAHPTEDPDRVADVVEDLLLGFVQRPQQYDPGRLSLRAYLKMAAGRDLLNARAKECRRRAREIPLESVAEPAANGKEEDEDDVRDWLADSRVAAVIAGFDTAERAVWELMLTGERAGAACAGVLGIVGRPVAEQEREVKRVKDRIKARLRRAKEAGS
jgi:RNA polymerase sigma-70 factor, ECF subfamily